MSTKGERHDDDHASLRNALGVLAVIGFAIAIACLVVFVILA